MDPLARQLYQAACQSDFPRLESLRQQDAGPNAEDQAVKHRVTPIYLAGNAGHRDMFELLLSRGANPEKALTVAMWNAPEFEEYGRLALTHGANIDKATADGKPLLNHLIQWGRLRHATWLRPKHRPY